MPFINFNKSTELPKSTFDHVIIGAGAAGILLAVKLSRSGKNVMMIESGNFHIDEKKQLLNHVIQTGKNLANSEWGRKRAVGGTTLAWGGQSLPFIDLDFKKREWVLNSGWPFSLDTLKEFYLEANQFMGIDSLNYANDIFKLIKVRNPGIDPHLLNYHVSKWAPEPNFQTLYKKYLRENVTVVYNAQLIKITVDVNGRAQSVKISNFLDFSLDLPINNLIIAAGGIETVRILLNNKLGVSNGWLGKCFMEHPCITIGEIVAKDNFHLQRFFSTHFNNKRKYSIRLSLSEKIQIEKRLLNCSGSIMFLESENDLGSRLKALKTKFKITLAIKLIPSLSHLLKSIYHLYKHHFFYKQHSIPTIVIMCEQEPQVNSYITLAEEKDSFKVRKANINWQISSKTWETILKFSELVKVELEKLKFGKVILKEEIKIPQKGFQDLLSDVNHHMGGSRMSVAPEDGIVDLNLKMWEHENIYICSTATFPTSSHSNPTLTMLALGCRLVKHLNRNKDIF